MSERQPVKRGDGVLVCRPTGKMYAVVTRVSQKHGWVDIDCFGKGWRIPLGELKDWYAEREEKHK